MVKKGKIIISITLCVVAVGMFFLRSWTITWFENRPFEQIEYHLGFELPSDIDILYNYQPILFFYQGGRPPQYTVFQFEHRPDAFLSEREFVEATLEDIPSLYLHSYKNLGVPNEYWPPWDEEFVWLDSFPVYLIYFEERQWLVAII